MKRNFIAILIFVAFNASAQKNTTDIEVKYNRQKGTVETKLVTKKVDEPAKSTNSNTSGAARPSNSGPAYTPTKADMEGAERRRNDKLYEQRRLNEQKQVQEDFKKKQEVEKAKQTWGEIFESNDREKLEKSYPNRLSQLKIAVEKSSLRLEPNNVYQLRKLATDNHFTEKESQEIFPADEYGWMGRSATYNNTFPLSQVYLIEKKAKFIAENAELSRKKEAEAAKIKAEKAFTIFTENGKSGIKNEIGEIIINSQYDYIDKFELERTTALAKVRLQDKYGVINKRLGKEIITPQYEDIRSTSELGIIALKDGKWGVVDILNNIIVPFQYEKTWVYDENGLMCVHKNNKQGFIDRKGNEVVPIIYDNIMPYFKNGKVRGVRAGVHYYIDEKGNETKVD
uniref:WG repeat-containing protein n=1 Tax=Pedobacter schmidteae TaxID=2201271 RepID=UPI0013CF2748|nr:WG repeat-containing protein [Pedobacter schmidteae]